MRTCFDVANGLYAASELLLLRMDASSVARVEIEEMTDDQPIESAPVTSIATVPSTTEPEPVVTPTPPATSEDVPAVALPSTLSDTEANASLHVALVLAGGFLLAMLVFVVGMVRFSRWAEADRQGPAGSPSHP